MEATPVAEIECPYCSERINAKSKKCKHCGEILDSQMREIELLKSQKVSPTVFMNAGGGSSSSSAAGGMGMLRRFPHLMHIIISIITAGLWIPVYLLLYVFRNKRYYA